MITKTVDERFIYEVENFGSLLMSMKFLRYIFRKIAAISIIYENGLFLSDWKNNYTWNDAVFLCFHHLLMLRHYMELCPLLWVSCHPRFMKG